MDDPLSFQIFFFFFYPAGHVLPAVYSFVLGMSFQLFILSFHFTDLILGAAFVVAAVNAGRCLRCFSGRSGSDKPFKIARYAILVMQL